MIEILGMRTPHIDRRLGMALGVTMTALLLSACGTSAEENTAQTTSSHHELVHGMTDNMASSYGDPLQECDPAAHELMTDAEGKPVVCAQVINPDGATLYEDPTATRPLRGILPYNASVIMECATVLPGMTEAAFRTSDSSAIMAAYGLSKDFQPDVYPALPDC